MTWLSTTTLLGVPLLSLLISAGVALACYFVVSFALRFAIQRVGTIARRSTSRADDVLVEMLARTSRWLLALMALLVGVGLLDLPARWSSRVGQLWFVVLALQVALWANTAVAIGQRRYAERHAAAGSTPVGAAATLVEWGVRTLIWAVVLLAMLSNLGVNITAFIASLGVGGIAIALAAQNILGDLFASVAIALDKPFEVGDGIALGSVSGTVETVGVKTTRIRGDTGEQIVMSNTEMLKQTVRNYKRQRERHLVFGFGVSYDTSAEQAAEIPALVKRIVEAGPQLRFDRAHFKNFGDSALNFEVAYTVLDAGYGLYMDEQQRINLALMRELSRLGVQFALPTRTVRLVSPALSGVEAGVSPRGS